MTATEPHCKPNERASALGQLVMTAAAMGLGVLIAVGLVVGVLIPRFGLPGDLNRVATLGRLLESEDRPADAVLIVTNSVGVEGVSAKAVEAAAGGTHPVENFSANGLDLVGARLLIGKMLASEPRTIVWILRPEHMGRVRELNHEFADVMRLGNFADYAPWLNNSSLDADTIDRLTAPAWKNRLALRTVPLRLLSERVRTAVRSGILPAKPTNLDDPFQMALDVSGPVLERNMEDMRFQLHERTGDGDRAGVAFIRETVAQIRAAGVEPILIIAPTHPELAEQFAPVEAELLRALAPISAEYDAPLIDATRALGTSGFADAIHPNTQGRAALSGFIGESLAAVRRDRPLADQPSGP